MKAAIVKTVAPEFNRCLVFATSRGPIVVKVLGDEATAKDTRDALVAGLSAAGLQLAPAKPVKAGK